jgi:hypothetical protein
LFSAGARDRAISYHHLVAPSKMIVHSVPLAIVPCNGTLQK